MDGHEATGLAGDRGGGDEGEALQPSYSFGAWHEAPLAVCLRSRGLDCSSFVSLSLPRAGLLASDRARASPE